MSNICPISGALEAKIISAISPHYTANTLAKLDGRTREARLMRETRAALVAHVGGTPSATQAVLIDRCVQLTLRVAAMDRKFAESGSMTQHDSNFYLAWSNSLSRALRDLGMKATGRKALTLTEHIARQAGAAA
jgi:hypothetical protein